MSQWKLRDEETLTKRRQDLPYGVRASGGRQVINRLRSFYLALSLMSGSSLNVPRVPVGASNAFVSDGRLNCWCFPELSCGWSNVTSEPRTGLLCSSGAFGPLGRRCRCKVERERSEGALTSKAAAYPPSFCEEVARLTLELAENKCRALATSGAPLLEQHTSVETEVRGCRSAQHFVSHLWSTQLAEALPWKTIRACQFFRANHKFCWRALVQIVPMNARLAVFQGSLVALRSHAKGHSSRQALNRILKKFMAFQLAKNVVASGFHCPAWALRADDASWQKRVRPPRPALIHWFLALKTGQSALAQDALDSCSGNLRSWGRWLLFGHSTVLASSAGYSSVGVWAARNRQDLEQGRVIKTTAAVRERLWEEFAQWMEMEEAEMVPLAQLVRRNPIEVAIRLEEYGRVLYERGETRRNYAETVNWFQRHPFLKTCLAGPWRLLTTWEALCPSKARPPFPLPLLKAAVTTDFGLGMASFCAADVDRLLRLIASLRTHCSTSKRLLDDIGDWALQRGLSQAPPGQIQNSRGMTTRCKVGCAVHREVLKQSIRTMAPQEKLWPHASSLFRKRMQQVLQSCCSLPDVCVPSSSRPGGATSWFRERSEDLVRLQRRGRWMHFKTLAHYIQELGYINVLDSLTLAARVKVQDLANQRESACHEAEPSADLSTQVEWLLAKFRTKRCVRSGFRSLQGLQRTRPT